MKIKILKKQYYKGSPLWFNDYICQEFDAEWDDYWHKEYKIINGEFKGMLIPVYCCERCI